MVVRGRTEYIQICRAVGMGFVVMGFIGYFVKLVSVTSRRGKGGGHGGRRYHAGSSAKHGSHCRVRKAERCDVKLVKILTTHSLLMADVEREQIHIPIHSIVSRHYPPCPTTKSTTNLLYDPSCDPTHPNARSFWYCSLCKCSQDSSMRIRIRMK